MKLEYTIRRKELEEYIRIKYKEILEKEEINTDQKILNLLTMESFIRGGWGECKILERYKELMQGWYILGVMQGIKTESRVGAGVMAGMIIRGEMYRED